MIVKIAIIILLVVLLFGCNTEAVTTQMQNENIVVSVVGKDIYRSRYMAQGMTYEVVYIKADHIESSALEMSVINLTLDSLKVEQTKLSLQP